MKQLKHYNALSPELLNSTRLQKDETVIYKVYVQGKRKTTPLAPNIPAIPVSKNVPPIDQIWDENKKDFVTIAAIRNVKSNGNPAFYDLTFRRAAGGRIILKGGRVADQEIHSYLKLTDFNGSKPDRDPSKPVLFHYEDLVAIATAKTEKRTNRRVALNTAADLSEADVRMYTASRGQDETRPLKILRDELEDFADKDPDGFMQLIGNTLASAKSVINRALKARKIQFSDETSQFQWPTGEPILTVARSGADGVEEFATWATGNPKGEKVLQLLGSSLQSKPNKPNSQSPKSETQQA